MIKVRHVIKLEAPTAADWKALRTRHGLTQVEFAQLVHRSEASVRSWERGEGGDMACWHLALLLLGEIQPPAKRRHSRAGHSRRTRIEE